MPERDGLTLIMYIMEIMASRKMALSELVKEIEQEYGASCYQRRDFPISKSIDRTVMAERLKKKLPKKILGHHIAEVYTFDGLKIILDNDEWLLIRPSGTEPILRLYSETGDKKQTEAFLDFGEKITAAFK